MTGFKILNPDFERATRASFAGQALMREMGVGVHAIAPGRLTLAMDYDRRFTQQHGFLHGGVVAACLDTACAFAAFTLMPTGAGVLTVEYKTNFLRPAKGARFVFTGEVVKPGRTLSVTEGQAFAEDPGSSKMIATLTATIMTVDGREDVKG
ncbi:MAG: PaaI family thioesterase [Pseudomonadota bacterium]